MELLEKETFYYKYNDHLIEPVHCAFLKKTITKGLRVIKKQYWPFSRILIGYGAFGHQNLCLD